MDRDFTGGFSSSYFLHNQIDPHAFKRILMNSVWRDLFMRKIVSVSLIALVFGGIGSALAEDKNTSKPNILFFAFDDLRPLG